MGRARPDLGRGPDRDLRAGSSCAPPSARSSSPCSPPSSGSAPSAWRGPSSATSSGCARTTPRSATSRRTNRCMPPSSRSLRLAWAAGPAARSSPAWSTTSPTSSRPRCGSGPRAVGRRGRALRGPAHRGPRPTAGLVVAAWVLLVALLVGAPGWRWSVEAQPLLGAARAEVGRAAELVARHTPSCRRSGRRVTCSPDWTGRTTTSAGPCGGRAAGGHSSPAASSR